MVARDRPGDDGRVRQGWAYAMAKLAHSAKGSAPADKGTMTTGWIALLAALAAGCSKGTVRSEQGSAAPTSQTPQKVADERQIRPLQSEWMQAWVEQDRSTIERILAPEYQLIVSSMPDRPVTREQWIGMLPRYTAEGFEYEKMSVRIFGDTAVVSSLLTPKNAKVDRVDRSFTFFITDVWRKRDGRWQVVGRYSSLPEQRTASAQALHRR